MLLKKGVVLVFFISLMLALSLNSYSAVLINEILANGIDDPNSEWVELLNNGSSDVNLTNWNISETSSKNFTLDVFIPNNEFIILTRDFATFNSTYPNVNTSGIKIITITTLSFSLSDSSGEVRLYNSSGTLVDSVAYAQASGKTFENISVGRYPDGSPSIFNLSTLTPGAKNDNQAPTLNKWIVPSGNNTRISALVNITVNITDDTTQVNSTTINFNGTNFSMAKQGDIWHFLWNTRLNTNQLYNITAYFNDSFGSSGSDTLFNITVNNTNIAPNVTSVNLTNTDFLNRTNGTLQAFFSFSDLDGDSITANETKWYNNSEEVLELINFTSATSNYTKKNQNWTFSVRVFDSFNWSEWANSTNLTIRNSHPVINITIQNITVNESELVDINISGNLGAVDNDTLTFSYSSPLNSSGQWQTSFTDARNYTITVNVSDNDDSFDFQQMTIEVLDMVNGENDTFTGNITDIKTNVQNLELRINKTPFNSSSIVLGLQEINFTDGNLTLAVFDFNFTNTTKFNFIGIKINRTKVDGAESLVIKGIDLASQSRKKTMYLNRTDTSLNSVCVKDFEIASIDEMSSDCSSETKLACDGIATDGFTCTLEGTFYKVTGLSHSGVKQISFARASDSGSSSSSRGGGSGGGSGGGGGVTCISNWLCEQWSQCFDGIKNRVCVDTNQCAFPTRKPSESEQCLINETKENIAGVVKPLDYDDKINRIKEVQSKEIAGITGQSVKSTGRSVESVSNGRLNYGVLIVFAEIFIILGIYSAIRTDFLSKIFK